MKKHRIYTAGQARYAEDMPDCDGSDVDYLHTIDRLELEGDGDGDMYYYQGYSTYRTWRDLMTWVIKNNIELDHVDYLGCRIYSADSQLK